MDIDSIDRHIRTLTNQHTLLEHELDKMLKQKSWNEYDAENIKKQKLKVKDELSRMHRLRYEKMNEVDWEQ